MVPPMSGEPFPNVPSEPANSSAGEAGQTPAGEEPIVASLADDAIVDLIPVDAGAGEPVLLRLKPPERPRPGFLMAVVWCLALMAVQLFISFIAGFIGAVIVQGNARALGEKIDRAALLEEVMDRVMPWLVVLETFATVVFAFVLVGVSYRARFKRLAAWRDCLVGQLALGMLLLAAVLVLETELNVRVNQGLEALFGRPSEWTSSRTSYIPYFDELEARIAQLPWWLLLVGACLFPAVGEELLFRGYIGRGLVGRYGPVAGVLLTSLLFGLMHVEPVHVCATALLGVVLHVVHLATKSLWAPILLHALNNVFALGWRKLAGDDAASMVPATDSPVPPLLLLAAFVAALAAGWLLYKTRTRWTLPGGEEWSPGYVSAERPPASTGAAARAGTVEWTLVTAVLCVYAIFPAYLGILIANWVGPEGPPAQLEQADLHLRLREYEKAAAAYSRVLEAAPDSVHARLNGPGKGVSGGRPKRPCRLRPRDPVASRLRTCVQRARLDALLPATVLCRRGRLLQGHRAWSRVGRAVPEPGCGVPDAGPRRPGAQRLPKRGEARPEQCQHAQQHCLDPGDEHRSRLPRRRQRGPARPGSLQAHPIGVRTIRGHPGGGIRRSGTIPCRRPLARAGAATCSARPESRVSGASRPVPGPQTLSRTEDSRQTGRAAAVRPLSGLHSPLRLPKGICSTTLFSSSTT